jgi:hypothetical protein
MDAIRFVTTVEGETLSVHNMGRFISKRVELIILPIDEDRDDMTFSSLAGLSRAYSEGEPEYSETEVGGEEPGL